MGEREIWIEMDTEKAQKQTQAMSSVELCWRWLAHIVRSSYARGFRLLAAVVYTCLHMFHPAVTLDAQRRRLWSSTKFHIAQEPSTRLFREAFALGREIRVDETSHYRPLQFWEWFFVVPRVVVLTTRRFWSVSESSEPLGCSWLFMAVQLTLLSWEGTWSLPGQSSWSPWVLCSGCSLTMIPSNSAASRRHPNGTRMAKAAKEWNMAYEVPWVPILGYPYGCICAAYGQYGPIWQWNGVKRSETEWNGVSGGHLRLGQVLCRQPLHLLSDADSFEWQLAGGQPSNCRRGAETQLMI